MRNILSGSGPHRKAARYLLSVLGALAVTILCGAGFLNRVDKWMQDSLYQHRGAVSRDIVIFGIDDEAFDLLGPYNTWDRNIMASALEKLASDSEKRPAVTAVDVLYTGRSSDSADKRLSEAASSLGNVVVASLADFGQSIVWEDGHAVSVSTDAILGYEQPYQELLDVTEQGHINAMTDRDGVLRHAILYVEPEGSKVYSMAAQAARIYLEKQGKELKLPKVSRTGQYYVSYTGKSGDYYDGISIAKLLKGEVPPEYYDGKIVLIGMYDAGMQDAYFTTIDKSAQMFGVEYQANVIQSLMEGKYKTEVPDRFQLLILFIVLSAAMILFIRMRSVHGAMCAIGLIAATALAEYVIYRMGYILHPLWMLMGIILLYIVSVAVHYANAVRERHALALEKERISAELSLATRIQANALPKEFPPFPERKEFDIYASMTPAKEVGGDLYDFYLLDEDHLAVVIGDVSGKGIPASLFMMMAMTLIHHVATKESSPAKILQTVNNEICLRNPEEMFVTVWLGILEISTGKLTCANAGHEYPAIKKPNGSFELFKDKHGFVVGGMEGIRYREYELQLLPGTKIFVYSDGVPEANNQAEELYGTDRMIAALQSCEEEPPQRILETVRKNIDEFAGEAPQFDDLTMLCIHYKGTQKQSIE